MTTQDIDKERVQVLISPEIEAARKRYAVDMYGPRANVKSLIWQQAMVEFLKARGYIQNGVSTQ